MADIVSLSILENVWSNRGINSCQNCTRNTLRVLRTPENNVPNRLGHICVLDGATSSANGTPIRRSGVGSIIAEYNPLVCYSLTNSKATHSWLSLLLTGVTKCHTSFQTLFQTSRVGAKCSWCNFEKNLCCDMIKYFPK